MTDATDKDTKRIGEYLACSRPLLQSAVKKQGQESKHASKARPLGEILFEDGFVSRDELDAAIQHQRRDRLRRCPVFATLSDMELSAISTRFIEVSVAPDQEFIVQDQPDPRLYVIATGKVEVYRIMPDGKHIHFAYVGPPEPIGEMGYFQGGIRTASVRAVEATEMLRAEYIALSHYFEHVPRVAHEFMRIVDRRRRATEKVMATPPA